MTALPATLPATNAVTVMQPPRPAPLLPTDINQAMRLAEVMATGKLVPAHLQKSPADCLAVIMQAIRWQTDPFATAQCTSVIGGRLMFEGKLVAAVVNTSGRIRGRLEFEYFGKGDDREVTCAGHLIGEPAPVKVTVKLRDAKTSNKVWVTQPDQQLAYHSCRVWARRYCPELMLGIYAREDIETESAPPPPPPELPGIEPPAPPPPASPPKMIDLNMPGGEIVTFPKTLPGIEACLHYMRDHAEAVLLNLGLLDQIASMKQFAELVADVRSAAAEALVPDAVWPDRDSGSDSGDSGDSDEAGPENDAESVRRAVAQGSRPPEMTDAEASNLPE